MVRYEGNGIDQHLFDTGLALGADYIFSIGLQPREGTDAALVAQRGVRPVQACAHGIVSSADVLFIRVTGSDDLLRQAMGREQQAQVRRIRIGQMGGDRASQVLLNLAR